MRVEGTGYGAGTLEFVDRPNVLRIVTGESAAALAHERMLVMETHIDDMNPELLRLCAGTPLRGGRP